MSLRPKVGHHYKPQGEFFLVEVRAISASHVVIRYPSGADEIQDIGYRQAIFQRSEFRQRFEGEFV